MGARHNLGVLEIDAGNIQRAVKHFIISAEGGDDMSLKNVRKKGVLIKKPKMR